MSGKLSQRIKHYLVFIMIFLLLFTGISPVHAFADDLSPWSIQRTGDSTLIRNVSYGNNTFVAVGDKGTILTSSDGANWNAQVSGTTKILRSISYENNIFVAVGESGTILTSSDGVTWNTQTSGTTRFLNSVSYGNNTFVAVGNSGTILTSIDGVTWNAQKSGTTNILNSVGYGNNTFVAVGENGIILTSGDGIEWKTQTSDTTNTLNSVSYGNNAFVAVGNSGTILESSDGAAWKTKASGTTNDLYGVGCGNNVFAAVGNSRTILTSSDGAAWETSMTTNDLKCISYGSNTFVTVGNSGTILTSSDGTTWKVQTSGTTNNLITINYINNTFVAVGENETILISSDGTNWKSSHTSSTENRLNDVSYGNNTFVAVGENGIILTSRDGITWNTQISDTTNMLYNIKFDNNTFITVGEGGTILISNDGAEWNTQESGTTNFLNFVSYSNDTFVVVGDYGTILTSSDGVKWNTQKPGPKKHLNFVSYGNGVFVVVGEKGIILTSSDGATWNTRQSGSLNDLYFVRYDNSTFVVVGDRGTILISSDGADWKSPISGTTNCLNEVGYGDNTFVVIGDYETILKSRQAVSQTYTIAPISNETLSELIEGYESGKQEKKEITITRTGTGDLNNLKVTLSGKDADKFEITQPTVTTLDSTTLSTTFKVKGKDELKEGSYKADITISADNMTSVTFNVVQVVKSIPAPTSPLQDDENNTFGWINVPGYTSISNYEYSLDSGNTWNNVTENPQTLPEEAYAVGAVQVRVKADVASGRLAGSPLLSTEAYTKKSSSVDVTLSIGKVKAVKGETLEVPVSINKPTKGIGAYGLKIKYDPAILEVVGIIPNDAYVGGFYGNINFSNEKIAAAWGDMTGGDALIEEASELFKIKVKVKSDASLGDSILTIDKANKDEFEFVDVVVDPMSADLVEGVVTVVNSYTVTFDVNGGSVVHSQKVKAEEKASKPTDPTKTGYTFGGWYADNTFTTAFDFNSNIKANTTIYAKWNVIYIPDPSSEEEVRVVPVVVEDGGKNASIEVPIVRTKDSTGEIKDTVKIDEKKASETVEKALELKSDTATLIITDIPNKNADKVEVQVPKASMTKLGENHLGLNINTEKSNLKLPKESIEAMKNKDIKITINEVRDASKIAETKEILKKLLTNSEILGESVKIETNFSSRTQIIIPIKNKDLPKDKNNMSKFIASLGVLIQHSDGENKVDKGEVVYDKAGNPIGVSIWVDKFSTFTLLKMSFEDFDGITYISEKKYMQDKEWTISFNKELDPSTVNTGNVYVMDREGNMYDVIVKAEGNSIKVTPIKYYDLGKTLYLYVTKDVKSTTGKSIGQSVRYAFTIGNIGLSSNKIGDYKDMSIDKEWIAGFNHKLDKGSLSKIKVYDENCNVIDVAISLYDDNHIKIAPSKAYKGAMTYYVILDEVTSIDGKKLLNPAWSKFKTK